MADEAEVEVVARVLHRAFHAGTMAWDRLAEEDAPGEREEWRSWARAAIEALNRHREMVAAEKS